MDLGSTGFRALERLLNTSVCNGLKARIPCVVPMKGAVSGTDQSGVDLQKAPSLPPCAGLCPLELSGSGPPGNCAQRTHGLQLNVEVGAETLKFLRPSAEPALNLGRLQPVPGTSLSRLLQAKSATWTSLYAQALRSEEVSTVPGKVSKSHHVDSPEHDTIPQDRSSKAIQRRGFGKLEPALGLVVALTL